MGPVGGEYGGKGKWKGREGEFERELIRHARTGLPGFATPEWVVIVEELPVRMKLVVHERDKMC